MACTYCGVETVLPYSDTCNECQNLTLHLPKFLSTREGQHLIANALESQRNKVRMAEIQAKVDAISAGKTTDELHAMIAERRRLMSEMVGNLYPRVLDSEIVLIEKAIEQRTRQGV